MSRNTAGTDNPFEVLILILIGVPVALAAGAILWGRIANWMTRSGLLVEHPLLEIPGTGGAGLDLPRLTILGCLLLIILAWTGWTMRTLTSKRKDQRK